MIDAMPYLPMVKAKAPKAPMGAAFIRMSTTRKIAKLADSRMFSTGLPLSPTRIRPMPNRIATNSTCRMLPSTKADTSVVGMMSMTNPVSDVSCAFSV